MELNILHLYPESMNLYGEYANLTVLKRLLELLGVRVNIKENSCEDIPCFEGADLIYMGAGTERSQKSALMALHHHADALRAAVAGGAVVLFTGSAMPALGKSVTDCTGKVWPGLALADFTTEETDRRRGEDVIALRGTAGEPVVGFMNKCSVTRGITTPLFQRLTLGFGNESPLGAEGYRADGVFATHITGPVLVKNPGLLEELTAVLFRNKGWTLPEALPTLPYQREAYAVTLRELQGRVK